MQVESGEAWIRLIAVGKNRGSSSITKTIIPNTTCTTLTMCRQMEASMGINEVAASMMPMQECFQERMRILRDNHHLCTRMQQHKHKGTSTAMWPLLPRLPLPLWPTTHSMEMKRTTGVMQGGSTKLCQRSRTCSIRLACSTTAMAARVGSSMAAAMGWEAVLAVPGGEKWGLLPLQTRLQ